MRSDVRRLDDLLAAAGAITSHLQPGAPLADGPVFGAIRVRLIEIGELTRFVASRRSQFV